MLCNLVFVATKHLFKRRSAILGYSDLSQSSSDELQAIPI